MNPCNVLPQVFDGSSSTNKLWCPTSLKKEVVVLHDSFQGPHDLDLEQMERDLKKKYGPTAAVSRINSIAPSMTKVREREETTDLWDGQGKRGNCLSSSDRLVIRRYISKAHHGFLAACDGTSDFRFESHSCQSARMVFGMPFVVSFDLLSGWEAYDRRNEPRQGWHVPLRRGGEPSKTLGRLIVSHERL
jgi:hypothetical protein